MTPLYTLNMLEGLDKIEWAKIRHAYGPATDTPVLIRELLAYDTPMKDDPERHPIHQLWATVNHQGDITEALSYTVPFLMELLASKAVGCKKESLSFLLKAVTNIERLDKGFIYWEDDPELFTAPGHKTRKNILRMLPSIYYLLDHNDRRLRQLTRELISRFPEVAD